MPMQYAQRLTAALDTLPTLPDIVAQVMAITDNAESSAEDLLTVIATDPVYTAKILKLANSALYSRVREITTLKQAIMVIGFEEIRNLVVASAVFNNFQQIKRVKDFDAAAFWRHAFHTGLAARMLAETSKLPPGQLFVAGLLHDIGKLVMLIAMPEDYIRIVQTTACQGPAQVIAEREILGVTHAATGSRLFNHWMFQDLFIHTTGNHHSPLNGDRYSAETLLVHLADLLTHISDNTPTGDHDIFQPGACFDVQTAKAAETLNIAWNVDGIEPMVGRLRDQMESQADVLAALLS